MNNNSINKAKNIINPHNFINANDPVAIIGGNAI